MIKPTYGARMQENLSKLPPFAEELGVEIVDVTADKVVGQLVVTPKHANRNGVMHGGAIMGFADVLGGLAAAANLDSGYSTVTVESKTNFIRAVQIGSVVKGVCEPINIGKKIMIWQTKIFREDNALAAVITQTQMTISWN
ncbi:PaaI family thioesterase [Marinomonas sp. FW-1]|uniref:PaaI family thioesterase n=1 Tax=Marinomonas sp. FW-1 TaxID=2071621 RepID=UPI0010C100EC|nr:PaaI family thioesterase [Marinomonas sp. FW-1]